MLWVRATKELERAIDTEAARLSVEMDMKISRAEAIRLTLSRTLIKKEIT